MGACSAPCSTPSTTRSGTWSVRSWSGPCRATRSGRRPASSTAASGSRRASRDCSAWTCRRSTAGAVSPTSASTSCWTRRSSASARPASGSACTTTSSAPYLLSLTTEEQKRRWLPGFCSGELITAIAMSEPGAGSDLQRVRTHASRDGDDWVLNGSKTFITNGDQRRPRARGRPHRPGRGRRPRAQPARGRARDARLRARPQPRQDRAEGAGHGRAVLRRGPGAGGQPAR